jgi:transposase
LFCASASLLPRKSVSVPPRAPAPPRIEGTHKGRHLDLDAARALVAAGAPVRAAARQLGASEATLRRALWRAAEGASETLPEEPSGEA